MGYVKISNYMNFNKLKPSTKVLKSKVAKAGIGYLIGNYLIKGVLFLTLPLFARLLSSTDYGLYNTFIATEGLLSIIIGWAIHASYKSAWYKYNASNHREYYECQQQHFAFCFIFSQDIFSLGPLLTRLV